jgi:hypothetical protein
MINSTKSKKWGIVKCVLRTTDERGGKKNSFFFFTSESTEYSFYFLSSKISSKVYIFEYIYIYKVDNEFRKGNVLIFNVLYMLLRRPVQVTFN